MATISTALRNFKEPTKDQLTQIFFSIPPSTTYVSAQPSTQGASKDVGVHEVEKMDINAVLSLGEQGVEDSYVRMGRSSVPGVRTD